MPAGLGWHPYFVRTPGTVLTAEVRGIWLADDEAMPTALVAPPPARDPTCGVHSDAVALDNCFAGWGRCAVVAWPEWRARLVMTADGPLACS